MGDERTKMGAALRAAVALTLNVVIISALQTASPTDSSATYNLYVAGGFSIGGSDPYTFGSLDLSSNTSARTFKGIHSWTEHDLPGMTQSYCGPTVTADDNGTVYAFAASGCSSGPGGFADSAVLGYHLASGTTTVHKGIPTAQYKVDPKAATGPTFQRPFFDPVTRKFLVVSVSNVAEYEFTLSMLLEHDPVSGVTRTLLELPAFKNIDASVYDQHGGLFLMAITDVYNKPRQRTAVYNTRTGVFTWHNKTLVVDAFAGFDTQSNRILALKSDGCSNLTSNYQYGHVDCSDDGCEFESAGLLDGLWCGNQPEYGILDKVEGIGFDPVKRVLSVQTSGCYNVTAMDFNCYSNLGSEKFLQYELPEGATQQTLTPTYKYAQATNYNDGKDMSWMGLALMGN